MKENFYIIIEKKLKELELSYSTSFIIELYNLILNHEN